MMATMAGPGLVPYAASERDWRRMLCDLRHQAARFRRAGYDGHNRRSALVTMRRLALRRARRNRRRRLRTLVHLGRP